MSLTVSQVSRYLTEPAYSCCTHLYDASLLRIMHALPQSCTMTFDLDRLWPLDHQWCLCNHAFTPPIFLFFDHLMLYGVPTQPNTSNPYHEPKCLMSLSSQHSQPFFHFPLSHSLHLPESHSRTHSVHVACSTTASTEKMLHHPRP